MPSDRESTADLISLRTAHLGMIQGVISRMSGFSATAKNFAVTASVAMVALAFDRGAPHLLWTGIGALVAFGTMDFYYHLLEVRFRELYQATARSPLDPPSDMLLDAPDATAQHIKKVLKSRTLLPFYVLLFFASAIALYEASHVSTAKLEPDPTPARDSRGPPAQVTAAKERAGGPVLNTAQANQQRVVRAVGNAAALKDERSGNVQ
jgi:hypothetical protein